MKFITYFQARGRRNALIAGGVALVVIATGVIVALTHASGFFAAVEPESGTIKGNAQSITDTTASGGKAIQFNGGVATGGGKCALTASHVPDGTDGMNGCWPGPSNTGPNWARPIDSTTAVYTGPCTITAANTVIDTKVITCNPLVVGPNASGLVIKNSYINGGVISNDTATFTIQDSLLDNGFGNGGYACGDPNNATTECGVGYKNFTILRTEITDTNRAAYCEKNCTIQDSYFHGTNLNPVKTDLAHASSVRNEQYLTLRHNSLACDFTGPFNNSEIGCSADMSGYPDFAPIMHDTIDSNLFLANNIGAGFCVYGGGTAGKPFSNDANNATYIVFTNNIFQRGTKSDGTPGTCGTYGPVTDFKVGRTGNVWTNNKYDNGTTVNPQ